MRNKRENSHENYFMNNSSFQPTSIKVLNINKKNIFRKISTHKDTSHMSYFSFSEKTRSKNNNEISPRDVTFSSL
jgi:hypothetical protein